MLFGVRVACVLLAWAAFVASAIAQEQPPEGRTFVLVVGVEDYNDPKITDLAFAEDDAQAVYDYFAKDPLSPTTGERVMLLRGKRATRVAIRRAIRDHLIRRAVAPEDTAIFYFAGHGFSDAYGVYLGSVDSKLGELEFTGIAWSELQRDWSKIGAGRRVFIADACHSGGLAGLRGPGGIGKKVLAVQPTKGSASVVIAATGANELSVEDKKSKHGVFTASLLEGLRGGADGDRSGTVSLGELGRYLEVQVPQRAKAAGGNQRPNLRFVGNEAYARGLVLSRGKRPPAEATELAKMAAKRKAAERQRAQAELRLKAAQDQLRKLEGASAEERERARAEAAQAKLDLAKAQAAAQRVREVEQKRIAAEQRAARAEAENAELRRKVAVLEGNKAEAEAAAKEAAAARARERALGGGGTPYERAVERAKKLSAFSYLDTKPFACGGQRNQVARFTHKATGLVFHLLPGGSYQRGSERGVPEEEPVQAVQVQPFLISATECTQAAWAKLGAKGRFRFKGEARPVERVTWDEVQSFCSRAKLRLPSESEWEYACRAGTTRDFSFGESKHELKRYAEFEGNNDRRTQVVAGKLPNAFGLYDVHGNVGEWCQDSWFRDYYEAPQDGSAREAGGALERVVRGGSWRDRASHCRSAKRFRIQAAARESHVGFRPACSLPAGE
jgi:formylglycine-generating enzyme required for sulfatase activity